MSNGSRAAVAREEPGFLLESHRMPIDPALAAVEVKDIENRPVRLGTLWADRPAVLVWVRHFG
jgi:hypothetical protein